MTGVQRIGRKAEIEKNIRNIQRGTALAQLEQDQKDKVQDLKMRQQLLERMKEETDTNLEQIEAIKIEISLTKEMITKQEELIKALQDTTSALRAQQEESKKTPPTAGVSPPAGETPNIGGEPLHLLPTGGRKELKRQITHLKEMIGRDQGVSPEQILEIEKRQVNLKRLMKELAAYDERYSREPTVTWAVDKWGLLTPSYGAPPTVGPPMFPDKSPGISGVGQGGVRTAVIPGTGPHTGDTGGLYFEGEGAAGPLGPNLIKLTQIENTRKALVDLSNSEFESIRNTARGLLDNYDTEKKIFKTREDSKDTVEETLKLLRQQKHLQDTTFKGGWGKGMDKMRMDSETIFSLLGEQLPVQMRDGMVTAMEAALDGAESFGDAMEGVMVGLLRSIRQAFLTSAATSIVGMFPGGKGKTDTKQKGGFIHAQNGMFVSGSGNGDRYPSMLEAGEYVLNRNAVNALGGPGSLDSINFGAAPRFQAGGGHRMNLAEKLPSARMSGLFLSQGNPEYDDIAAAAVARLQKKQEKYQEKEDFKAMLISTLISAGMSAAAGWAGSKMEGWDWGRKTVTSTGGAGSGFLGRSTIAEGPALSPQRGGYIGRQTGGLVGSTVRRYGLYQGGGSVPVAGGASALGGGGNTNNISINIDLGGNTTGGGTGGSQGPTGNTGTPQAEGQNPADAKALGEKIKSQVLKVIAQEQRVGGSLSPSARKGG
jgi:hypothetical protein